MCYNPIYSGCMYLIINDNFKYNFAQQVLMVIQPGMSIYQNSESLKKTNIVYLK